MFFAGQDKRFGYMKASLRFTVRDVYFAGGILLIFLPFVLSESFRLYYISLNNECEILMAFMKFAVLATMGEVLGLRIKTGCYLQTGFGLMPRAVVWGLLGITIHMAFVVFPAGVTHLLDRFGMQGSLMVISTCGLTFRKVFVAFCISVVMNTIYAPVMMTFHKVTDTHITQHNGSLHALVRPINMGMILSSINWQVQWGFVFKKTIPLFWIPAHTITFLLPEAYRVLFAALLGIMLGVILAVAAVMGKQN